MTILKWSSLSYNKRTIFMLLCCRFQFPGSSLGTPRAMTLYLVAKTTTKTMHLFFLLGLPTEARKPDEIVETASEWMHRSLSPPRVFSPQGLREESPCSVNDSCCGWCKFRINWGKPSLSIQWILFRHSTAVTRDT